MGPLAHTRHTGWVSCHAWYRPIALYALIVLFSTTVRVRLGISVRVVARF